MNSNTISVDLKLEHFLNNLTTLTGAAVVIAFLLVIVVAMFSKRARWIILTLMLWVSTFGYAHQNGFITNALAFPLSLIQAHAQALTAGLLLALMVSALFIQRGWRRRVLLGGTAWFLLLEFVFTGRALVVGDVARGLGSMAIFAGVFIALAWGLSRQIQSLDDVIALLRCICVVAVLVILGTIYQLIINRHAILWGNRLYATTANPQFAGMLFAICLMPMCYLVTRRAEPYKLRLLWGCAIGFSVFFLMWTGSRTAALMALLGVALFFRTRIGKFLGVAIVATIIVLAGMQFYAGAAEGASHLIATNNSRAAVWADMISNFVSHPLFGTVSTNEITSSMHESSYLSVASATGLIGLIPLIILMIAVIRNLIQLWRQRAMLGNEAPLIDLMIAGIGGIAAGAMFEVLLLGTLTYWVFCVYIYLTLLTFLLDWLATAALYHQYANRDALRPDGRTATNYAAQS